jgi:tRNA (guanine-N7-)-methyltransferase
MPQGSDNAGQHRPIRSFVRRAGRLTGPQQRALQEDWPDYGLDYEGVTCDFDALFGRNAPVVLEIGFGNGESLVEQAARHPERDFLGIEVHEPGIGHCLIKARAAGVTNLKLVNHDAVEVLEKQVPEGSLERVNLYFPDPWPKKRHHKRRIVRPEFLDLLASRLRPGGSLHIATDWANYAEHIDEMLAATDRFELVECRVHAGDRPLDRPQTKFERRGLRHGHAIWDWRFDRSDQDSGGLAKTEM